MVLLGMWYALASLAILCALVLAGRMRSRRATAQAIPALQLLPPREAGPREPGAHGITVKLRPAPGAPNTDPPTDRHVTERGSASIHRRTGRRRSTTNA